MSYISLNQLKWFGKRYNFIDLHEAKVMHDNNESIKNYISSIAIEATRNILLQNLSKDKKSALIEESITEFNSVLKN